MEVDILRPIFRYSPVIIHSLCYEQTVMFVNTLRLYIGLEFSLKLEKNFDARPVGRVLIHGSYR